MVALVACLVVSMGLAGCGGGGSSGSSSEAGASGELSKAEWISRADAICTDTNDATEQSEQEYESLFEDGETPKSIVEGADLLRQTVPVIEAETEQLRELPPPTADAGTIDAMLGDLEAATSRIGSFADQLENGETSAAEETSRELQTESQRAKGIAQGYGLKVCGADDEGS